MTLLSAVVWGTDVFTLQRRALTWAGAFRVPVRARERACRPTCVARFLHLAPVERDQRAVIKVKSGRRRPGPLKCYVTRGNSSVIAGCCVWRKKKIHPGVEKKRKTERRRGNNKCVIIFFSVHLLRDAANNIFLGGDCGVLKNVSALKNQSSGLKHFSSTTETTWPIEDLRRHLYSAHVRKSNLPQMIFRFCAHKHVMSHSGSSLIP